MEQARNLGNFALWLSSHLLFTLILDLALVGGYQSYQWYLTVAPQQIDVATLEDASLNELSKQIFKEQDARQSAR